MCCGDRLWLNALERQEEEHEVPVWGTQLPGQDPLGGREMELFELPT